MRQQFGRRLVHSSSVVTADSSMVQQLQSQGTFDQNQSFEDEWSMVNFANAGGLVVTTSSSTGLEGGGGGSPQPESLTGVSFACAILEKAILDEAAGGQGNCKEVGSFKTGCFLACTTFESVG